jgi:hypothetical protein
MVLRLGLPDIEVLNYRPRWTTSRQCPEIAHYCRVIGLGMHFDATIRTVGYPAANPQSLCCLVDKVPEPYTLNTPFDDQTTSNHAQLAEGRELGRGERI